MLMGKIKEQPLQMEKCMLLKYTNLELPFAKCMRVLELCSLKESQFDFHVRYYNIM